MAPFFAGFFAAAFFVAMELHPLSVYEISFIVLFHIAEIALLVKFFFSFFVFSVLARPAFIPIRSGRRVSASKKLSEF